MIGIRIAMFPGDGVGPEIMEATESVLVALDRTFALGIEMRRIPVGLETLASEGTTIPNAVWDGIDWADGAILAPLDTQIYPAPEEGGRNLSSELRLKFKLGSNVRPSVSRPWVDRKFNLVICRENTEGFYAVRGMHQGHGEFMPDPDTAFALRKISRSATRRVAETAFELSKVRRHKITVVHKGNVLKLSDGLFLDEVRRIALDHPEVRVEEMLVDAAAAHLVRAPEQFDVVLTTNLFGDILSNQAAELAGGLGVGASLNIGADFAVAQAAHGSAPDIARMGIANPTALILSSAMLLDWFGRKSGRNGYVKAATAINQAIDATLATPANRTRDMGGALGTTAFMNAVVERLVLRHHWPD